MNALYQYGTLATIEDYGVRAKRHLGNPNTISKNMKVLRNKDIVEMKGG